MAPLAPPETIKLPVEGFQGIDIERGILERPISSFARLENFDLVKQGVIRKILGNIKGGQQSPNPIVAIRDWQPLPTSQPQIITVDNMGGIFKALNQLSLGTAIGQLFTAQLFDSAPFAVCLPLIDNVDGFYTYVFVTCGKLGPVRKTDGFVITDVGVPNPGDSWDPAVPYQHSVAIPQVFYQSVSLATPIYEYTSPNASQGQPVIQGWQYRASFYNPRTQHDSSLFPLSLQQYPTQLDDVPPPGSKSRPLGTAVTFAPAQYMMAVPLFFDNLPNRLPSVAVTAPETGYSKVRIWRTKDGSVEYFLVPRLYDQKGIVVTDVNGAIDITNLFYGFSDQTSVNNATLPMLYDGFIPLINSGFEGSPMWFNALQFDAGVNYTVNGGSQTGTTLNVTFHTGVDIFTVVRGQFTLPNDSKVYTITGGTGSPSFTISPAITTAPTSGAQLTFLFTPPVSDQELIIPFVTAAEAGVSINTDRLNDPPPKASWGVVYQNRLFLTTVDDPTKIVFSRVANYESFPPDNSFSFTQADFDPITALLTGRQVGLVSQGADAQVIVGKERSSAKITGNDASNFAIQTLFAETGIVHKRGAVIVESDFISWSRRGLELMQFQTPTYIGKTIKDLFDKATFEDHGDIFGPSFTDFRRDGELLLGLNLNRVSSGYPAGAGRIDTIILMRPTIWAGSQAIGGQIQFFSPYSLITAIPGGGLGVLLESGFGDNVIVLAGANDGHLYQLFTGGLDNGQPLVAVAETQLLPQDDKDSRKVFRRIRFGGNVVTADAGWKIQFSVDDGATFTVVQKAYNETLIGLVGKQLVIRLIHDRAISSDEAPPQLSNFTLEYVPIGVSRAEPVI